MLFTPIRPMLVATGIEIINTEDWLYQVKWDGWRVLIHKAGDRIEAFTREGNNITAKFPELEEVGHSITVDTAIIDTEGVVLRQGISVFEDFSYRGILTNKEKIKEATITHPVTFVAFDILTTDKKLMHHPLFERKEHLSSIITPSNSLQVTPSVDGDGSNIFEITKDKGMEGIIGKKRDSIYQLNHRSKNWLKYKHFKIIETVILAYRENPFSILVGTELESGRYKRLATVEFGFKPEEKMAFRHIAKSVITTVDRDLIWLEPRLYCKVQYLEKTNSGLLRTVSFKGFIF
ncbi:DNA ligase [Lysinibacillus sphaericus]|nr:DNA ligase [Lysinibacillus sphaericus]MBE5085793.1 DNA ligase [Bacillus thuringiensis]MDR0161524.1 DNA ligase [Lysinibacillus sphaericus]QPA52493.1 DNA ligase [Lysinibacillus sphaericus]